MTFHLGEIQPRSQYSETRHDRKTVSLQDLFKVNDQLTPWAQSSSRTPITQIDETHELAPAKSQRVWTFVDNCLDFDVLTEYCLTYQNRHYAIIERFKFSKNIVFRKTLPSNTIYALPVHFPSGPPDVEKTSPFLVTRRELHEAVCFIEHAIQMLLTAS